MPVFHHPRRVEVVTGGEPLVPLLGAVALVVIAAGAYALMSWLADVLGVLGEVQVPVVALVPGAVGFAVTGYLLGRCRIAQRAARARRAELVAVPVRPGVPGVPGRPALSQGAARRDLGNWPETVPAGRRAEGRP